MSVLIKTSREEDCYVLWSERVDGPLAIGTRAQMLRYLCGRDFGQGNTEERLARADRSGSSALWPSPEEPIYGWDDSGLIADQRWLPRENLTAYTRALTEGRQEDALEMTEIGASE